MFPSIHIKILFLRQFDDAGENLFKLTEQKVNEAIEEIIAQKAKNAKSDSEKGMLEKMIDRTSPDSHIPVLIAMDGLGAGIDTTGNTMGMLLHNLATNPEKQEKLRQEIDSVVGKGAVTEKHLAKMRYLKACLQESLRYTPTSLGTSRVLDVRSMELFPVRVSRVESMSVTGACSSEWI